MNKRNNILRTETRLFKVRFQFNNKRDFICDQYSLITVLRENETKAVESIKIYDAINERFKRVSKSEILNFLSFDTESSVYLNNHYFFK